MGIAKGSFAQNKEQHPPIQFRFRFYKPKKLFEFASRHALNSGKEDVTFYN
ncbi:MAG: hypothetical protein V3R64_04190 [Sphingomonadales bacterium]